MRLSKKARIAAEALLAKRPPVIPGTRFAPNQKAREKWYADVCAAMKEVNLPVSKTNAFCDVAGVPD